MNLKLVQQDDLLLSGSEGYLLLSLATSGASQTSLLFNDGGGSYPVAMHFRGEIVGGQYPRFPYTICKRQSNPILHTEQISRYGLSSKP